MMEENERRRREAIELRKAELLASQKEFALTKPKNGGPHDTCQPPTPEPVQKFKVCRCMYARNVCFYLQKFDRFRDI
jgi:hypothetical protein